MSGTTLSTLAASASLTVRRYLRSVNSNIFVWQTLREARAEWDIVWRSGAVPNTVEGLTAFSASSEGAFLRELIGTAKCEMLVNEKGVVTPVNDVMIDAALLEGWVDSRTYPVPPVGDLYTGFSGDIARQALDRLHCDWELETAELGSAGSSTDFLYTTVEALLLAKGAAHPIYEAALVPTRPYILAHPAILHIYALFTLSIYHDFRAGAIATGTSVYTNRGLADELVGAEPVAALRRIFVAVVREEITF